MRVWNMTKQTVQYPNVKDNEGIHIAGLHGRRKYCKPTRSCSLCLFVHPSFSITPSIVLLFSLHLPLIFTCFYLHPSFFLSLYPPLSRPPSSILFIFAFYFSSSLSVHVSFSLSLPPSFTHSPFPRILSFVLWISASVSLHQSSSRQLHPSVSLYPFCSLSLSLSLHPILCLIISPFISHFPSFFVCFSFCALQLLGTPNTSP